MAVQGPYVIFDYAIKKLADGTIDLDSHTIKAILTGAAQVVPRTFTGTSTDCRYADLTAQLSTASGYTSGGFTLTTPVFSRPSTNIAKFTADTINWTITSNITFKYCILYDDTATNKDLIAFCDMDTTSTSTTITVAPGSLQIIPHANGIFTITET